MFKPVIVFRTIFDLVNNRRLQVEKHLGKEFVPFSLKEGM